MKGSSKKISLLGTKIGGGPFGIKHPSNGKPTERIPDRFYEQCQSEKLQMEALKVNPSFF